MDSDSPSVGTPLVDLVTADPAAARRFYGPLLDWTFMEVEDSVRCVSGDAVVSSLVTASDVPMSGWRTCFPASPLDDVAERIRSGGGRVLGPAPGDDAVVYATDPAGVPFAVTDPPVRGPAPPGPGRPVWYENMTTDAGAVDPFYADVLGLAAVVPGGASADEDAATADYAVLLASGRAVGGRLVLPAELAAVVAPGWMVYFAQADPDDTAARATRLGGAVVVPPRDAPTGRVAALADPEGAVFTVINPA